MQGKKAIKSNINFSDCCIIGRLVILVCHVSWKIQSTIAQLVGSFLSNGLHQRLLSMESTPAPVMCGVMAVSCMRYGALVKSHSQTYSITR